MKEGNTEKERRTKEEDREGVDVMLQIVLFDFVFCSVFFLFSSKTKHNIHMMFFFSTWLCKYHNVFVLMIFII